MNFWKNIALTALCVLPLQSQAASIDVLSYYGTDSTAFDVTNNTGTTLNELVLDLTSWVPDSSDYTITVDEGHWLETGITTDSRHTFAPEFSIKNWEDGDILPISFLFDTTSTDSIFYGLDMSSLGTVSIANALTGLSELGTPYPVDLAMPNISAVPLPAAAWLFLTGLAGMFGMSYRNKRKA